MLGSRRFRTTVEVTRRHAGGARHRRNAGRQAGGIGAVEPRDLPPFVERFGELLGALHLGEPLVKVLGGQALEIGGSDRALECAHRQHGVADVRIEVRAGRLLRSVEQPKELALAVRGHPIEPV